MAETMCVVPTLVVKAKALEKKLGQEYLCMPPLGSNYLMDNTTSGFSKCSTICRRRTLPSRITFGASD